MTRRVVYSDIFYVYNRAFVNEKYEGDSITILTPAGERITFSVYKVGRCSKEEIGFNSRQLKFLGLDVGDEVTILQPDSNDPPKELKCVKFMTSHIFNKNIGSLICDEIRFSLKGVYLSTNCEYYLQSHRITIKLSSANEDNALFTNNTKVSLRNSLEIKRNPLELHQEKMIKDPVEELMTTLGITKSESTDTPSIPNNTIVEVTPKTLKDIKISDMKIGGLKKELTDIVKRAFIPRFIPKGLASKLGIKLEKGMILHGKTGCGKTLIARELASMVSNIPPIIRDAPSLFDKHVGSTESNIRELFAPAISDPQNLYIIIIDEIDALCRKRGSKNPNSEVRDIAVNQLLCCLDGVKEINNVFIIGMTNNFQLLDDAVLRPGRMGIHIHIDLPDADGRLEILNLYTKHLKENGYLSDDVDLAELSRITDGYTGAELESIVTQTVTNCIMSNVDIDNLNDNIFDDLSPLLTMENFTHIVNKR